MLYDKIGLFVLFLVFKEAALEGESCAKGSGVCLNIRKCQSAIDDIRRKKNPQICSFNGPDPIVCCVQAGQPTTGAPPVATTPKRPRTTTEYVPPMYDYKVNDESGGCEPLSRNRTAAKTGRKAWDMCIEYQEKYVYPCEKNMALTGELSRVDHCGHSADDLIIGGKDANRGEFPHMALLGFGTDPQSAVWLCGGSLISDRFILTAGHCTSERDNGNVTYIILGALKRSEPIDSSRVYKVRRIVKHPDYKPPTKYNDIALLETETQMKLGPTTVPACLYTGDVATVEKIQATGWGATKNRGPSADTLQKVTLTRFSDEECFTSFPSNRNMLQGVDSATQVCFGDRTKSKDTCQGDSGGPIQIKSKQIECMYNIVGVTSFGKACGFVGDPGIYTRVPPFVPWIESVVWPN